MVRDERVITHPEKVLFPDDGITKGELAAYYEAIAPVMLPHLRGRPVTMERYPAGIGKKGFWQKDVSKGFPEWLQRVEVPKKDGVVHHPIVDRRAIAAVGHESEHASRQHVWTSRVPDLDHPDICVFDLDPSTTIRPRCAPRRIELRDLLGELGLPSWIKTTGSKGFHIVVPLDGKTPVDEVARLRQCGRQRCSCSAIARSADAGVQQGRSTAAASTSTPAATATARRLPAAYTVRAEARRAGVGAVHVGGSRARGGRAAIVHDSQHGQPCPQGWRCME